VATRGDPGFNDFVLFASAVLWESAEPMDDDAFWDLVEWLDWGRNAKKGHQALAARLAKRVDLVELGAATAAGRQCIRDEVQYELSDAMDALWKLIPSDDGMDDFFWHIVGLGEEVVAGLAEDLEPALKIAREHTFKESFRYVFERAFYHYSPEDYREALTRLFAPKSLAETSSLGRNAVVVLEDGLLGVIIRVDPGSLVIATPTGERKVPWPT
jgi:hypothetical protein